MDKRRIAVEELEPFGSYLAELATDDDKTVRGVDQVVSNPRITSK